MEFFKSQHNQFLTALFCIILFAFVGFGFLHDEGTEEAAERSKIYCVDCTHHKLKVYMIHGHHYVVGNDGYEGMVHAESCPNSKCKYYNTDYKLGKKP